MKVAALRGLRAADLPPLEGELGAGLVALAGSTEDAAEVRRALLWAVATGDAEVEVEGGRRGATLEQLWGAAGDPRDAVAAAVGWVAGPALARVEAARAALPRGGGRRSPSGAGDVAEAAGREPLRTGAVPEELRAGERALRDLRTEWTEVTGDVEQATMEWLRERQDAETHLKAYRDRARELKARLAQLEAGGPEAPCPTCGRPLADHLGEVRVQLREEWESVVQDGRWWKRRRAQLEDKPEHLRALEGRAFRLHAALEAAAERLEAARTRLRGRAAHRSAARREPVALEARALERLAGELRAAARAAVLREAGRVAERITDGRVLWVRPAEDAAEAPPVGEGIFHGGAPAACDRAAVEVACRVAAARLARAAGAPLHGMVAAEALDALDPEDRLRAVDVFAELADALGQVVVVTGTDVVERRPEAFAQAFRLRRDSRGGPPLRPLAVGARTLVLVG